jgi:hypothetical protein
MLDYTLERIPTHDGSEVHFKVSSSIHNEFWTYVKEVGKKHNNFFRVRIDPPFVARTTGPRSQSARFNGHCADLAEQLLSTAKQNYSQSEIRDAMKRMAVADGYPTHMTIDGIEEPNSEASLSKGEMSILLRRQQLYADSHNFWLKEYAEDIDEKGNRTLYPYRSLHGRTREEMQKYYEERGET